MMYFGFSGRARESVHAPRDIITGSNRIRAGRIAELVEGGKVVIRRSYRGYGGKLETVCYPNPAVESAITSGYTYPLDWIATLAAFDDMLHADGELYGAAEPVGLSFDEIAAMVERIREQGDGRGGLDA